MNISSVIIQTKPEFIQEVVTVVTNSRLCEYHFHDEKGRIIVTIEGEGIENEIQKLRQVQQLEHVISADMVFSYSEDELEREKDKLLNNDKLPEWLNNPNAKLRDIKYNGDLKGKY